MPSVALYTMAMCCNSPACDSLAPAPTSPERPGSLLPTNQESADALSNSCQVARPGGQHHRDLRFGRPRVLPCTGAGLRATPASHQPATQACGTHATSPRPRADSRPHKTARPARPPSAASVPCLVPLRHTRTRRTARSQVPLLRAAQSTQRTRRGRVTGAGCSSLQVSMRTFAPGPLGGGRAGDAPLAQVS